jgi:methionyl-tRNA formyltransferase
VCACARRDCLNLHPSRLPRYRGPAPLFWQLRARERESGITLHRVSPDVDAGSIVGQARVEMAGGLDGAALEERFAAAGVGLFLERLAAPSAVGHPQVEAQANWQPPPLAEDFRIDPGWSARHAFEFMRGTAYWGQPYPVTLDGREFLLREALGCEPEAGLPAAFVQSGSSIRIQCTPGVLHASLA